MMIFRRFAGLALLLLLGSGLLWAAYLPGNGLSSGWYETHAFQIRRILNIPPEMEILYKGSSPSAHAGYELVEMELIRGDSRQPFELVVSSDGRKLVYDRFYDLADPFRAIVETINLERSPAIGTQAAPVTIVKYSDYTCSACRGFYLTMQEDLLERYGGRIRFHHKLFPAVGYRQFALQSAVAGACAYRQGNEQFWAMHDQLFRNVTRFDEGEEIYAELAAAAKLNVAEFKQCFDRQDSLLDVAADQKEGVDLRIEGTPTFFINGRPLPGVPSAEVFYEIIDQELALVGER